MLSLILLCCVYTKVWCKSSTTEDFDYIVVGSSVGGVVASRLAQANKTVLLLEAGPDDLKYSCFNDSCGLFGEEPALPSGFVIEVDKYFSVISDRKLQWPEWSQLRWNVPRPWSRIPSDKLHGNSPPSAKSGWNPRGKLLGGCSSHNAMFYCRGSRRWYNGLKTTYGLDDWSFSNMLPSFRKLETFPIQNMFHGNNGPIQVLCPSTDSNDWQKAFYKRVFDLGFPVVNDLSGYSQSATGPACRTFGIWNSSRSLSGLPLYRSSVPQEYIRPTQASHPSNLVVRTNSHVLNLIVKKCKKRGHRHQWRSRSKHSGSSSSHASSSTSKHCQPSVTGVRYRTTDGVEHEVSARKEVIVSAGSYLSPWLLMVSGIGDRRHLKRHRITPVVHSPYVGKNLHDHPLLFVFFSINPNQTANAPAYSSGGYSFSFFEGGLTDTDVQIYIGWSVNGERTIINGIYDPFLWGAGKFPNGESIPRETVRCVISVTGARSTGFVNLNRTDPLEGYPEVYDNFYSDPRDVKMAIEGIKKCREMVGGLPEYVGTEVFPGPSVQTDKQLSDFVLRYSTTTFHPTSTVAMGEHDDDPLDAHCRVRGVDKLRVVDLSIYPEVPDCNTNIPGIAAGERCSEFILRDAASK